MTAQQTNLNWRATWRTIAEFMLPAATDSAHTAVTQVASAVQDLNLAPAYVEQLAGSVFEAVRTALAQGSGAPLHIKVLVSALTEAYAACCWGFFLITRTADRSVETGGPARHTIEVFVYQDRQPQ